MDSGPREPASVHSNNIQYTTMLNSTIPLGIWQRNGIFTYWDSMDRSSSRGKGDRASETSGRDVKVSRNLIKEICPGDSTLSFKLQDFQKQWTVKVAFDRATHGPVSATLNYTYVSAGLSVGDALNFGFASYPTATPSISFNASVTFENTGTGIWDTITIVDQSNKSQKISRNDVLKPMSQGASQVFDILARSNFSIFTSMCRQEGLL